MFHLDHRRPLIFDAIEELAFSPTAAQGGGLLLEIEIGPRTGFELPATAGQLMLAGGDERGKLLALDPADVNSCSTAATCSLTRCISASIPPAVDCNCDERDCGFAWALVSSRRRFGCRRDRSTRASSARRR